MSQRLSYRLFLLTVGLAMTVLNLLDVPTLSDDMIYRFMFSSDQGGDVQTINSLGDLLQSQWQHFLTVNGRAVVHILAQAMLVFVSPVVVQLLNSLWFVVLLHFIVRWVDDAEHPLLVAVVSCFLLFVVFQGFSTAIFWSLGAFNYLWVLTAVMALLLWLRRINGEAMSWKHVLLAPLALLAGWSHEALSLPLSIAFMAWLLTDGRRQKGRAVVPYLIFFMAGTVLCLLSPGIWSRSSEGITLQSRLLSGVMNCVFNVRLTWLLALVLLVMLRRNAAMLRQHLRTYLYVYIVLVTSMGIVLLCGTNLERVAFFTDFVAMLLLLRLMAEHAGRSWSPWLVTVCGALLALFYVPALLVRSENAACWRMMEQQMAAPGQDIIAVRCPLKGKSWLTDYFRSHYAPQSAEFGYYCCYMAFDSNDINMRCAAALFHKERLTFLPEDVVIRMATDSLAYQRYEMDQNQVLYIWKMKEDRPVKKLTFLLRDEDPSGLLPHQRLLAYKGDRYDLDDFRFEVIHVGQQPYLIFTRPTTNIFRRIKDIVYE